MKITVSPHLHSFQVIFLQSGLVWDLQWEVLCTSHLNAFVSLVPVTSSGSWYHSSCLSLQVISGTIIWTSLGTSLHSCQLTGSQASVPAQTWQYNTSLSSQRFHDTCFPDLSVSQIVTQFCFVIFLHFGSSFLWRIVFLATVQAFSMNFFGDSFVWLYCWGSTPCLHSLYGIA